MKNIILIRHGTTEWNISGRVQGSKNSNLTIMAREEAKKAGHFLKNKEIDIEKIYSSDLNRAYETAEIINKYLNLDIQKTELLRENNFGIWEGKTKNEILDIDKKNYEKWLKEPENCLIKNGESLKDLRIRCQNFIKIIENNKEENILLVSHSVTIKMLILVLLNIENKHLKNLSLSNTGISRIEVKDYNTVLKYYNSTFHLEGDFYG